MRRDMPRVHLLPKRSPWPLRVVWGLSCFSSSRLTQVSRGTLTFLPVSKTFSRVWACREQPRAPGLERTLHTSAPPQTLGPRKLSRGWERRGWTGRGALHNNTSQPGQGGCPASRWRHSAGSGGDKDVVSSRFCNPNINAWSQLLQTRQGNCGGRRLMERKRPSTGKPALAPGHLGHRDWRSQSRAAAVSSSFATQAGGERTGQLCEALSKHIELLRHPPA